MEDFIRELIELGTNVGGKLIFAIVVLIAGNLVIKSIKRLLDKADRFTKLDKTVQSFLKSFLNVSLYVLLLISVISILGIPMTSVAAVIASCGLAIGLSLQGALSNLAGGLMILIFKPFRAGDYIEGSGAEGTVREISIFYTTIITLDNRRITVPNGDIMNANVTNYSSEELRRVDIDYKLTNDCDLSEAKKVLMNAVLSTSGVLEKPSPFVRLTAVDDDTYIVSVRAWCDSTVYWDVRYDLLEHCSQALSDNGIDDPEERIAVRLVKDED